jgi:DNA-binding IclR family transcriptional regulator
MTDPQVLRLIGSKPVRLTAATKIEMPELLADLAEVRQTGFAYDREEHAPGVCAIGTAIIVERLPPHAISIAVPASRFDAGAETYRRALWTCRTWMEAALSGKPA